MSEKTLIKTVNTLLLLATIFFMYGVVYYASKDHTKYEPMVVIIEYKPIDDVQWVERYKIETPKVKEHLVLTAETELRNQWLNVPIYYKTMEKTYLGRYFITAYCPEECGYNGSNYPKGWSTASSTICHYHDDWSTPTTCAIDRNFHRFGEIIQVGDGDNKKIYITEDTGPGVRGRWVDCFVETMDEVRNWNTRYDNVYSISYEEHVFNRKEIYHEYFNYNLLRSSIGDRYVYGPYR